MTDKRVTVRLRSGNTIQGKLEKIVVHGYVEVLVPTSSHIPPSYNKYLVPFDSIEWVKYEEKVEEKPF